MGVATWLLRDRNALDLMNVMQLAKEHAECALNAESSRTADFGTRVHDGIECYLKGWSINQQDWGAGEITALDSFKELCAKVGFVSKDVEKTVISRKHIFAGRLDWVTELPKNADAIKSYLKRNSDIPPMNGGLIICDFKTGAMNVPTQTAQIGAYAQAYKEETGIELVGGMIINIPRETPDKIKCHYVGIAELKRAFNLGFKTAYRTWFWFQAPKWFKQQKIQKRRRKNGMGKSKSIRVTNAGHQETGAAS
jgi:hypothetical protein